MNKKTRLSYKDAEPLIREGDVLLFRGRSWISFFIGRAGETAYSHVGLASWVRNGQDILECIEFREGGGGRSSNLERQVQKYPSIIDVYRPIPRWSHWEFDSKNQNAVLIHRSFDGRAVTHTMRHLTGLPYGWRRLWWIAKHKLAGLRLLFSTKHLMHDEVGDVIYPVCSTAVAYSFNANGYDLIHNRGDSWTEPGQIAESTRLSYLFTLEP